ncbi:hypothetical protein HPB52_002968 [Rhipicephalus sanguineus]|uniref:Uncharacterized protein n=1 Tax=Rhipicephalus sanguineus TaxID=34632 RepID=A0A9D4Q4J6_RHISA|nr:hypothetical protein HPB52_002968 [Rhipicephalus sanguineus]
MLAAFAKQSGQDCEATDEGGGLADEDKTELVKKHHEYRARIVEKVKVSGASILEGGPSLVSITGIMAAVLIGGLVLTSAVLMRKRRLRHSATAAAATKLEAGGSVRAQLVLKSTRRSRRLPRPPNPLPATKRSRRSDGAVGWPYPHPGLAFAHV